MYTFIDTTEASDGNVLPSEALKINGKYIEDLIEGYRTLNVSGREALSPELLTIETGSRDGSKLKSKRYPERFITVRYQLIAKSNEEFREAYNKLGGILNVEDAELIFHDEEDKYFIGTPYSIGEVDPGRNSVVGEFEILCVDPFKYSVVEYEAEASLDDSSVLIDYNGTYKAYPTLEADFYKETEVGDDGETAGALTGAGDCGYVAFFNEDERIVQLGDPDEKDGEAGTYAKSQTLMNQTFLTETAWGTTAKKLWTVNSGIPLPVTATQTGSVAMALSGYNVPTATNTSATLLNVTSTANTPRIKYTISAKTSGRTASSVKVNLAITASLGSSSNYFGNGYVLKGSVYIGGAWHDVTLKKSSDYWRGSTGHTVNLSVTVSGLSTTTTSITGIKFKATRTDGLGTAGTLAETACGALPISAYGAGEPGSHYLTASSYGSGSAWHGAAITRSIGADASGAVGAVNFTFTWQQKMSIGSGTTDTKQLGGFHAYLTDASNKTVAGVRIVKTAAGKSASLMLFVNGVKVHQVGIDLSYYNKYFGNSTKSVRSSSIKKAGSKIYFNIGGYSKTFTDDAVADLAVTKATFMFEQYSTSTPLTHNGLYTAKFIKNNCSTLKDIPNKFSAGDVLIADCKNGEITLNGIPSPDLGALGNDWEEFYLTPGLNQIGIAFSDWVEPDKEPTLKVRYREVYL